MRQMAGLRLMLFTVFLTFGNAIADEGGLTPDALLTQPSRGKERCGGRDAWKEDVPNPVRFIWNYPDNACRKMSHVDFDLASYGFESNKYGFQGETITLLYSGRNGKWPFIDSHGVEINGGLPQNGDLKAHLEALEADLKKGNYGDGPGIGVFDMELWRPVLDRNFGRYSKYPLLSLEQVKSEFPNLSEEELEKKNEEIWTNATRYLMEKSLQVMKKVWPDKLWGYYGYPEYSTRLRNDRLQWLWDITDVFYPSIYIKSFSKSVEDTNQLNGQKLEEAFRVRQLYGRPDIPIIAYDWVESIPQGKFYDEWLDAAIRVPAEMGVDGIILWATYKVFAQPVVENCEKQEIYIKNTLGPKVKKTMDRMKLCSAKLCGGRGRCVNKAYAEVNQYVKVKYPPKVEIPISTVEVSSAHNEFMDGFVCQCYKSWMGERCQHRYE